MKHFMLGAAIAFTSFAAFINATPARAQSASELEADAQQVCSAERAIAPVFPEGSNYANRDDYIRRQFEKVVTYRSVAYLKEVLEDTDPYSPWTTQGEAKPLYDYWRCAFRAAIAKWGHPSAPTPRSNLAVKAVTSQPAWNAEYLKRRVEDSDKTESYKARGFVAQQQARYYYAAKELQYLEALKLGNDPDLLREIKSMRSSVKQMKDLCAQFSGHPCLVALPAQAVQAGNGTAVPPLRPTITQEAHNPAGEATDCVRVIGKGDFEAEHVSTTQKAVFRNTCSHPVEVTWCTKTSDCKPGYTNLFTVPAKKDRGFSYEPSVRGSKVEYAACYNGFVPHQGELSKKLTHACK